MYCDVFDRAKLNFVVCLLFVALSPAVVFVWLCVVPRRVVGCVVFGHTSLRCVASCCYRSTVLRGVVFRCDVLPCV